MHEGFLTSRYTLLAQASFACAFLIYTTIYFQHKRRRLRYRMVVYQEANAIYKLIHIKNPPHFLQYGGFFLSFLDFVQQVARYVFYQLKCGHNFINFSFGVCLCFGNRISAQANAFWINELHVGNAYKA